MGLTLDLPTETYLLAGLVGALLMQFVLLGVLLFEPRRWRNRVRVRFVEIQKMTAPVVIPSPDAPEDSRLARLPKHLRSIADKARRAMEAPTTVERNDELERLITHCDGLAREYRTHEDLGAVRPVRSLARK